MVENVEIVVEDEKHVSIIENTKKKHKKKSSTTTIESKFQTEWGTRAPCQYA